MLTSWTLNNINWFNFTSLKPNFFRVFSKQDSSQLKILNESDGLLIRKPYEKELLPGTKCKVLLFKELNRNQI